MGDATTNKTTVDEAKKDKRPKATKALPTDRIRFPKQLDILRAYGALSNEGVRAVSNNDLAGVVTLNAATVSLSNPFFLETGLITRAETGYLPCSELVSVARAVQFGEDAADAMKLVAPVFGRSWCAEAVRGPLSMKPLTVKQVVLRLAEAVGAQGHHEDQLAVIVNFLAAFGVVERDGDLVRLPRGGASVGGGAAGNGNGNGVQQLVPPPPAPPPPRSPERVYIIDIAFKCQLTDEDMNKLKPDVLDSLMTGVKNILLAKKGIDGDPQI